MSGSGVLGQLQMVSGPVTGRCPEVDCEISHLLERGTKHSLYGCGNLSL